MNRCKGKVESYYRKKSSISLPKHALALAVPLGCLPPSPAEIFLLCFQCNSGDSVLEDDVHRNCFLHILHIQLRLMHLPAPKLKQRSHTHCSLRFMQVVVCMLENASWGERIHLPPKSWIHLRHPCFLGDGNAFNHFFLFFHEKKDLNYTIQRASVVIVFLQYRTDYFHRQGSFY